MTVQEELQQIQSDTTELVRLAERSQDLYDGMREEIWEHSDFDSARINNSG